MSLLSKFKGKYSLVQNGRMTYLEFAAACIDFTSLQLFGRTLKLRACTRSRRGSPKASLPILKQDGVLRVKNIKLPLLSGEAEYRLFCELWEDSFWSYIYCDDKYDEETFERCDTFLPEGLYGLVNDKVNVTVNSGDIVIDAGSWIGDFAAYASVRGATTYAFEPTETIYHLLEQTATLNPNIIAVNKGLSDENTSLLLYNDGKNTEGNTFISSLAKDKASSVVETIRLDDFVREYNLPHVDFIKADIEGFERHMLAGAQETLARFAPKLALCTYHLPDDPQVMTELILKANPKYNIVQKRKKLFASVPE